ncbi:MAG: flagellar motor switch protein FliN [SAR324 cluster bacterium]|nr:flagellar motor switch protein FliN [SAR324 cluster bacterium]
MEGEGGLELDDDLNKLAESVGDAPSGGEMVTPSEIGDAANLAGQEVVNLEFLLDIKLHVTFEVGRSKMLISDLLTLGQGSVIELHRLVGDDLDLMINGKLVAKGEVVVVNEKFGCRIIQIIPPEDRIKFLAGF